VFSACPGTFAEVVNGYSAVKLINWKYPFSSQQMACEVTSGQKKEIMVSVYGVGRTHNNCPISKRICDCSEYKLSI
jgi:hypothetical protein